MKHVVITGLLLLLLQAGFAQDTVRVLDSVQEATVTSYLPDVEQGPAKDATPQEATVFRQVPDSVIKDLQQSKEFEYANDPAYWPKREKSFVTAKEAEKEDWLDWLVMQNWFRYMVLTLMAAVLLFALIKIAISNRLVMFTSTRKSGNAEEDELLQKDNLAALIQEAEAQDHFRQAVRYRYMKALQEMDEKQIIALNAQSTNWDYVNKLASHPLKKQFLLLTRAYEYVWYGEFQVNKEQYGYLRTEFLQFENALNK
jgi:Domain of unknown function (DUF4129)